MTDKSMEFPNLTHTWAKTDRYLERKLIPRDPVLEHALDANDAAGLPHYDVTAAQGKLLQLLIRMSGAKRVLEIGTLGGVSTIWMARGLPEDGRLITLELEPLHARIARENLDRAGIGRELVDIRTGDAARQLALLEREKQEPFDFIFIDADKPNNPVYLKWALRLSKPGTVIVGDNVVREGAVIEESSADPRVRGVRRFFDLLAEEPRIDATAIQTVGVKGYDGFMLGIVRE
ncbi:O-methyltransferase [Saccharibacillus sp. CPCC 101409]|uniref:O-methyltransferase n=1 Tax=Saccharibacillus sp. CPCC 101409 TaxID=3058041 RepID=UPI002673E561|nr:O-methyltransferase [Saccharibacillus sp. CPCC 101409]MDO3410349.1 O-methyltransferase [Saccharibacillus sp. CPCC 101409]